MRFSNRPIHAPFAPPPAALLHEPLKRGPKPRRRWQSKGYGDLLQHDSSPHQWWPGENKQVTIVQQPGSFRVIARPPTPQDPQWPDILAEYRL